MARTKRGAMRSGKRKAENQTGSETKKKKVEKVDPTLLAVGDDAPDFEALDQDENTVKLSEIKKTVVLYFYPKDNTPGCKKEAIQFTKLFDEFEKKDIKILGVSTDSAKSHANFCSKCSLKHTLLVSNDDSQIVEKYKAVGKTGKTAKRITYIIGPDMKIVKVYASVRADAHASEVLDYFSTDNAKKEDEVDEKDESEEDEE